MEAASVGGRPRVQHRREPLWHSWQAIFPLLPEEALGSVVEACPGLMDEVCNAACDGTPASWAALACLRHALVTLGAEVHIYLKAVCNIQVTRLYSKRSGTKT